MTHFIPNGFVSARAAWAAAYLSKWCSPADDKDIALERFNAEQSDPNTASELREVKERLRGEISPPNRLAINPDAPTEMEGYRRRELATMAQNKDVDRLALEQVGRQWVEVIAFLFDNPYSAIAKARKVEVRNALLQALFAGDLIAHCAVSLSAVQKSYHTRLDKRLPEPIEPVESGGVWLTSSAPSALNLGTLVWSYSEYDTPSIRPMLFKRKNLAAAFPDISDGTTTPDGPFGPRLRHWYSSKFLRNGRIDHKPDYTMARLIEESGRELGQIPSKTAMYKAIKEAKDQAGI